MDPGIAVPPCSDDVSINQNMISYNYDHLIVADWNDGEWRSLLKFNVGSISDQLIILSSELELYYFSSVPNNNARTIQCHQMLTDWDETASWINTGQGSAWSAQGGDYKSTAEDTKELGIYGAWHRFTITELTKKWISDPVSNPNYGVLLMANDSNSDPKKYFRSKDYTSDATKHPKLRIKYTVDPIARYSYDDLSRVKEINFANGGKEINECVDLVFARSETYNI